MSDVRCPLEPTRVKLARRFAWAVGWVVSVASIGISLLGTANVPPTQAQGVTQPRIAYRLTSDAPPGGLDELKAIQTRIQVLRDRIIAATVAIQVGRANGSGVVIDAEGHVLTAAHVAGQPGRNAVIFLPNGRAVQGVTLGMNQELDAGLIQIREEGPWAHVPLGSSAQLLEGQFCLATGHPGGYDISRPPVLRWGRVLKAEKNAILTDCTLVGGDSGGPLFDLDGNVIGIHSRIGKNLTINVHVPIDPFRESWDRLKQGEMWGLLDDSTDEDSDDPPPLANDPLNGGSADGQNPKPAFPVPGTTPRRPPLSSGRAQGSPRAWLGVTDDPGSTQAKILGVADESPAALAGLLPGDVVLKVDQVDISDFQQLQLEIRRHDPGQEVLLQVKRGSATYELAVRLGQQP